MTRFMRHVRGLWPATGRFAASAWLWPVLPFLLWPAYCTAIGERRWEHAAIAVLIPALAWRSAATRRLLLGIYPLAWVGLAYDAMRFVKNLGLSPSSIHTCDLETLDAKLFFGPNGQSWPAWCLQHGTLGLDVFFAIPYATFIYVTIGYAFWLYRADYDAMRRLTWTFLLVNLMGFATYHIYPAAPPWYVHAHGCVGNLGAQASAGVHLSRVDDWLGVAYFASFYARSNDVFGAMPSLHVAYPLLVALVAWQHHRALGRTLAIGFWLWMSVAAVYLDHHWVADVVVGCGYTLLAWRGVNWAIDRVAVRTPACGRHFAAEGART